MLSTLCEAAAVGTLLLWPLLTNVVPPGRYVVTPVPRYAPGVAASRPRRPELPPLVLRDRWLVFAQPVAIPPHVQTFSSQEPPSVTDVGASRNGPDPVGALTEILGVTNHGGPAIQPPPQPVQRPKRPLLVSVGVMEARLIRRVEPTYPESARLLHMSGVVQLRAIIGTDGRVRELTVLSGNPILANAAQAAVRQWRYRPTFLDNQPVEVETFITVTFVLGEQ